MSSNDKVALVTGSSKGIGQGIAVRLAQAGYVVYVTHHADKAGGETTLSHIQNGGFSAHLVKLDVSDEASVRAVMQHIQSDYGHLDLLVNNAARDISNPMEKSSYADWKLAFDTKVHGAWLCTKYALPLLRKSQTPNVIMVSSNADERPDAAILSYAVATAAVNSMTKALAIHLGKEKIRVNAVMPGPVRTDNWGELREVDAFWQKMASENPLGRVATVEDVADAVLLLVEDKNQFFNGNFLFVNGGSHLQ